MDFVEGVVEAGQNYEGRPFPLVLSPGQLSVCPLSEVTRANLAHVEDLLRSHGAILFRGWGLNRAEQFADVVENGLCRQNL